MGCCCGKDSTGEVTNVAFQSTVQSPLIGGDVISKLSKDCKVVLVRLSEMDNIGVGDTSTSLSDPYTEMKLIPVDEVTGPQLQMSSVIPGTVRPHWLPPELFSFFVSDMKMAKIIISVLHYTPTHPIPLGDAVLKLNELNLTSAPINKSFKLIQPTTGKAQGTVEVSISVITLDEFESFQEHTVYEFERWVGHWGHDPSIHMLTAPGRWCSADGKHFGPEIDSPSVCPAIPTGWVVTEQWHTVGSPQDADGWQYATDFNCLFWYPENTQSSFFVRRRSWHRRVQKTATSFTSSTGSGYIPPTTSTTQNTSLSTSTNNNINTSTTINNGGGTSGGVTKSKRRQTMFPTSS